MNKPKITVHSGSNVIKVICVFAFLVMLAILQTASAQMFSVEGDGRDYTTPLASGHIGIEQVNFEYTGGSELVDFGNFAFKGPIIRFRFEVPNLLLSLGAGGAVTGLDNNYFDGAIKAQFALPLLGNERISFGIPFQLTSSLTSVKTDIIEAQQIEFRQANVLVGGGLRFRTKLSERLRIKAKAIPNYGFSTATGGSFGGSAFVMEGQARIYFDRLFGSIGLSAGYDYNFKSFDIEGNLFDYDLNSHGFLIGVTF